MAKVCPLVFLGWSRRCGVPVCLWALSWHCLLDVWGWHCFLSGEATVPGCEWLWSPCSFVKSHCFSFIGIWFADFPFPTPPASPLPVGNAASLQTVHRPRHCTALVADILSSHWTLGLLPGILVRQMSERLGFLSSCLRNSLHSSSFLSPSGLHFACFHLPPHLFSLHLCLDSL